MRKRTLLSLMALAPLVSACGFKLRGVPTFPFASLYLSAPGGSAFARELQRTLGAAGGALKLLRDPAKPDDAEVVLQIQGETRQRVVVGQTASGQARELQLRLRIRYRLYDANGTEWVPSTEMIQERDMTYDETLALAKDAEQEMLYKTMQTDLVQQMIRRLSAAKRPA